MSPICRSLHQNSYPSEKVTNNFCFIFWHFQWKSSHPNYPFFLSINFPPLEHPFLSLNIKKKKKERKEHGSSEMFGYGSHLGCLLACFHGYRSRSSELWQLWCTWGLTFPLNALQVSWSSCFFSCPQRDCLSSLMDNDLPVILYCNVEFLVVSTLSVFEVPVSSWELLYWQCLNQLMILKLFPYVLLCWVEIES